ncbi:hypothetical protein N2152v2_007515 [Parachlorella kessleri]
MASLANANLPSDDEEDVDYAPSEEDEESKGAKKKKAPKRLRGAAAGTEPAEEEPEPDTGRADVEEDDMVPSAKREAKKAKIDALWSQLSQKAALPAKQARTGGPSLASLCRPAGSKGKPKMEAWMRELGLGVTKPRRAPAATAEDKKAVAEAALAAAKNAASVTAAQHYGKVVVTETRRFAGKDIMVKREVAAGSKEAQKAAGAAGGGAVPGGEVGGEAAAQPQDREAAAAKKQAGLDAVLASLAQPKKVTVLDKSKSDWKDFKGTNEQLEEELESYKKSAGTYLEKKEFLQRAELREYEQERDKRLGADIRTRGRL